MSMKCMKPQELRISAKESFTRPCSAAPAALSVCSIGSMASLSLLHRATSLASSLSCEISRSCRTHPAPAGRGAPRRSKKISLCIFVHISRQPSHAQCRTTLHTDNCTILVTGYHTSILDIVSYYCTYLPRVRYGDDLLVCYCCCCPFVGG
jgi:hypothetical protein